MIKNTLGISIFAYNSKRNEVHAGKCKFEKFCRNTKIDYEYSSNNLASNWFLDVLTYYSSGNPLFHN